MNRAPHHIKFLLDQNDQGIVQPGELLAAFKQHGNNFCLGPSNQPPDEYLNRIAQGHSSFLHDISMHDISNAHATMDLPADLGSTSHFQSPLDQMQMSSDSGAPNFNNLDNGRTRMGSGVLRMYLPADHDGPASTSAGFSFAGNFMSSVPRRPGDDSGPS